jgi:hypothetical protein
MSCHLIPSFGNLGLGCLTCKKLQNLLYKRQCLCVCLLSEEIQTAGPISVKFGTGILFDMGKFLSWVSTPYSHSLVWEGPKRGPGCWGVPYIYKRGSLSEQPKR